MSGSPVVNIYGIAKYFRGRVQKPNDIDGVVSAGNEVIDALAEMGMFPTKLSSPIAIWEQCVLNHLDIPKYQSLSKNVCNRSWYCSGKTWIEAYKLGYWEKSYEYDISSAFPTVMKNLIDTRHCDIVESAEYQHRAVYGYCEGVVTIYDNVQVSPIIYELDDSGLSTRTGTWETMLTKKEIDCIRRWHIGEFKITAGSWLIPRKLVRPFKIPMERILRYKQHDNPLIRDMAKAISVGAYGKLGETHPSETGYKAFGRHVMPVYFAEISTNPRLEVADFIYRNKLTDSLIHVSVDGFQSDEQLGNITPHNGFQWKVSDIIPTLVISSGLIYIGDRTKPKGLTLDNVKAMVEAHPYSGYYSKALKRTVTLGDAVSRGKLEDIGTVKPMYQDIDLYRAEHSRLFRKQPQTGYQLMNRKFCSVAKKAD